MCFSLFWPIQGEFFVVANRENEQDTEVILYYFMSLLGVGKGTL